MSLRSTWELITANLLLIASYPLSTALRTPHAYVTLQ